MLLYVEANPVWMCRFKCLYSAVIFNSKLVYLLVRKIQTGVCVEGEGQGGHNLPLPVPRSPASRTFFAPLSPHSRPLLCFSRYHVNHAVWLPINSNRECFGLVLLKIGKKETDSCSFCAGYCISTQTFWTNVSQWTSEELDLTNLNITPFSPALCLGLIDNISNLLLHHFLLIARHYIYSCKLRNTIPMVQVYTQLVIRSMEIEKQIAFDNNNLASFRKKWATFKQCPSEYNLTNTVN